MKPTDACRELAKIAKQRGNHQLVMIYFRNMKMHRKRAQLLEQCAR